jgi:MFS family permease
MDELQPPASPQQSLLPNAAITQYKNQRTWLVLFGIVELLIAAFFGLMAAVMMALPRMTANRSLPQELPHAFLLSISIGYLLVGLCFVASGIGSILAKNWARVLTLVLSWCWLVCGIFAVIGQLLFIVAGSNLGAAPTQNEQLPPQLLHTVQIFTSIFTFVVFVVAPLTFIIFYTRKSVKATCQGALPGTQRERSVPVAILILVVLLGLQALALFWTATLFPAIAFFGAFLTGWGARVVLIVLAAVCVWLALKSYRQELRAWWIVTAMSIFFGISNLVTNFRYTVADIYRVMNIPLPSTAVPAVFSSLTFRIGSGALFLLAYLGFLLYAKRYFSEPARGNPSPALN